MDQILCVLSASIPYSLTFPSVNRVLHTVQLDPLSVYSSYDHVILDMVFYMSTEEMDLYLYRSFIGRQDLLESIKIPSNPTEIPEDSQQICLRSTII